MRIPVIELSDGIIKLRPYTKKDVTALHEAVMESLPELMPWMPWTHQGYDLSETRGWLKQRASEWKDIASFDFAITSEEDGAFLGGCGLNNIRQGDRVANLGYWVRTSRSAAGVAPAATHLLARWGFSVVKVKRIEILIAEENSKSLRVAEKVGAMREGVLRNRLFLDGRPQNAVMFSLIPGEV